MPASIRCSLSASLLLILCSAISCGRQDSKEQEALRLERDSLYVIANTSQVELERMTYFFDEVAECIDSITEQEALLTVQIDPETNRRYSQREMATRLNQLSEIIYGQREKIAKLVDSLNNRVDTLHTSGLRNTISYLTNQLTIKEAQINRLKTEISGQQRNIRKLKDQVDNLKAEVGNLSTQNSALSEAVKVQSDIINEGYVLVATKQQLKEMGVIEGGGLFKKSKTNLSNINKSYCNKVDVAMFRELPIHSRKVRLLSPAPTSSYLLNQNGDMTTLVISDANAFWSLSNILVIQIK